MNAEDPAIRSAAAAADDKGAKVLVQLRSVGDAPALKKNKFKLNGSKNLIFVEEYLRKSLAQHPEYKEKTIYLYCGQGFAPTLDLQLQDLYDCFQVGGELTITYGIQEAWG